MKSCSTPSGPRAPIAPSCIAKLGYQETVRKVYETVSGGKGTDIYHVLDSRHERNVVLTSAAQVPNPGMTFRL